MAISKTRSKISRDTQKKVKECFNNFSKEIKKLGFQIIHKDDGLPYTINGVFQKNQYLVNFLYDINKGLEIICNLDSTEKRNDSKYKNKQGCIIIFADKANTEDINAAKTGLTAYDKSVNNAIKQIKSNLPS